MHGFCVHQDIQAIAETGMIQRTLRGDHQGHIRQCAGMNNAQGRGCLDQR